MMPELNLIDLGAAALASWRLAALLVLEAGPWRVFINLRERVGIHHDEDGRPDGWPEGGIGRLLSCVWCMSFWTTLAVCAILWAEPYVVMVLAVWGAATLLEAWRDRH